MMDAPWIVSIVSRCRRFTTRRRIHSRSRTAGEWRGYPFDGQKYDNRNREIRCRRRPEAAEALVLRPTYSLVPDSGRVVPGAAAPATPDARDAAGAEPGCSC